METIRQKVVSVLIILGVIFSFFRCSSSEKEENIHEVAVSAEDEAKAIHQEQLEIGRLAREEAEHTDESHTDSDHENSLHATKIIEETPVVETSVPAHTGEGEGKTLFVKGDAPISKTKVEIKKAQHVDKTLFFKSDAFIQNEKIEMERKAAAAEVAEARERAEAAARVKAEQERARLEKEKEAQKLAAMKAEEERNIKTQKEVVRISQEKEAIIAENSKMKSAQEALLAKIKKWEVKATEAEANSKKLQVAAVAAAALATQQAVANAKSLGDKEVGKLRSTLEKLTAEKKALEAANAKLNSSQELLIEKIKEWEAKATTAKEASLNATQEVENLQSALDKMKEEKAALQAEIEVYAAEKSKLSQANVDMNDSINTTKAALLVKIEEWEKKALDAEVKEKSSYEKMVEDYKSVVAKLTREKALLEESNMKMKSAQEALLVKIEEWEGKANSAEEKSKNLKVATAAAAALATQQALANVKSQSDEKVGELQSALDKVTQEKAIAAEAVQKAKEEAQKLSESNAALQAEIEAFSEEKSKLLEANTELNSSMQTTKKELLVKIQEWEAKAATAEEESKKLKIAAIAAATLATQQAVANVKSLGEENVGKLQSALDKALEEKTRLAQENSELNTSMQSTKEELLAKIQKWENRASESEEKMKAATAAAALAATQKAAADAQVVSETKAKLDDALAKLEATKAQVAKIEEEKKRAEAEAQLVSETKAKLDDTLAKLEATKAQVAKIEEEKKRAEAEAKAKEQAAKEAAARRAQAQAEAAAAAEQELKHTLELNRVEFKYGSAQLTKKSEALLDKVSSIILEHSELNYDIQGHTDAHGNEDYNVKLSTSRAEAVKDYLMNKGIDGNILRAEGFGSSMPIADNSTNEGRLQNRRVVIKIAE